EVNSLQNEISTLNNNLAEFTITDSLIEQILNQATGLTETEDLYQQTYADRCSTNTKVTSPSSMEGADLSEAQKLKQALALIHSKLEEYINIPAYKKLARSGKLLFSKPPKLNKEQDS
ncbi:MAG: hypothetical protein COB29_00810, partial [Sulfitobacter sp.]